MRIDKKTDCPIILSKQNYAKLSALSELSGQSDPETAKDIAVKSAENVETIETLVPYFKKGLILGNRAFIGHAKRENYRHLLGDLTMGKRVHVKLTYDDWLKISPFQNALDCPRSHAVALLIVVGLERVKEHGRVV